MMSRVGRGLLLLLLLASSVQAEWRTALPGWKYVFPRDHGNHPDFKTEWWYFTGNLHDSGGRKFGYQLTFFRQGIFRSEQPNASRFVTKDVWFAHFTVSDPSGENFHFFQRLSRGAYADAGVDDGDRIAWIDSWSCVKSGKRGFRLSASEKGVQVNLELKPEKPPVIHGIKGVSQKSQGEGHASHYYSLTDLQTTGTLELDGRKFSVEGTSWFDHEWATNQLAEDQAGWDWLSLHLDNGADLMLYQLRRKDGSPDPESSGTYVNPDGSSRHLKLSEIGMKPVTWWESSGIRYPIGWEITVKPLALTLNVQTSQQDQELRLSPVSYWEGMVEAQGRQGDRKITGEGYLELTGYGGALQGLQGNPR